MSVSKAAKIGQRQLLEALRDTIAAQIDEGVLARDLASLSRRLLEINQELADLTSVEDGSRGKGRRSRGSRPLGEKFHDNCGCTVTEVLGEWNDPTVDRYRDLYEQAHSACHKQGLAVTPANILTHMRAHGHGIIHDAHTPEGEKKKPGPKPKAGSAGSGGGKKPPKPPKPPVGDGDIPTPDWRDGDDGRRIPVLNEHVVADSKGKQAAVYEVSPEYAEQMAKDLAETYGKDAVGKQVTKFSADELREFAHLYTTADGKAGGGVRQSGEIAALFSLRRQGLRGTHSPSMHRWWRHPPRVLRYFPAQDLPSRRSGARGAHPLQPRVRTPRLGLCRDGGVL